MKKITLFLSVLCMLLCTSCDENDAPTPQEDLPVELKFVGITYQDVTCEQIEANYPEKSGCSNGSSNPIEISSNPFVMYNDYCRFTSDNTFFREFEDIDIMVDVPINWTAEGLYDRSPVWEISYKQVPWNSAGHSEAFTVKSTVPPHHQLIVECYPIDKLFHAKFILTYQDVHTLELDTLHGDWEGHFLYDYRREDTMTEVED